MIQKLLWKPLLGLWEKLSINCLFKKVESTHCYKCIYCVYSHCFYITAYNWPDHTTEFSKCIYEQIYSFFQHNKRLSASTKWIKWYFNGKKKTRRFITYSDIITFRCQKIIFFFILNGLIKFECQLSKIRKDKVLFTCLEMWSLGTLH